jgi:hypothetical protein
MAQFFARVVYWLFIYMAEPLLYILQVNEFRHKENAFYFYIITSNTPDVYISSNQQNFTVILPFLLWLIWKQHITL